MCGPLRALASPLTSGIGRAALGGGVMGAVLASKRKKPAANTPSKPVLEPTEALRNSSLFNSRGGG